MSEPTKAKPKRAPKKAKKKPFVEQAPVVPEVPPGAAGGLASTIRDRILDFKRIPASEISDNERNWRTHPFAQTRALQEMLESVGIAGALTAYYSDRNEGKLTLIDGHARRSQADQSDWPVLILDVDDEEADMLLATYDSITNMAETDVSQLSSLLDDIKLGTPALADLVQTLRGNVLAAQGEQDETAAAIEKALQVNEKVLPEMELQPFEHYDYVVLVCKNKHDWITLHEKLGIQRVQVTLPNGSKHIGTGRVIDACHVVGLLGEG